MNFSKTRCLAPRTLSSSDFALARCAAIALAKMQPVPRIDPASRGMSKRTGSRSRLNRMSIDLAPTA
ncbi:hypothetical protein AU467_23000 [Mesorhizobium loti]|uniref:Uncharacterized protein n=1 Tax=Rhizobium loti TaxID=381 RepID=A0A101KSM3_RHILI|nr:hypothetical protein AU467_23000 [Mesorhizobium loti]